MRWDDFRDDHLWLHGEGDKERVVPLHAHARDALDELDRHDEYVLPWRAYRTNGVESARTSFAINPYLHSLGTHATAHSLRHWCATTALAATHDLRSRAGPARSRVTANHGDLHQSRREPADAEGQGITRIEASRVARGPRAAHPVAEAVFQYRPA